jgi:Cft2 family RNA processing exonuclease
MGEFDSSKGFQDILMSDATHSLLVAERDADLPYRENLFALRMGTPHRLERSEVVLISSGHMLGAVQVCVRLVGGETLGYSGDFSWPLEEAIRVDALVVDSTYGQPESVRLYSQEDAEQCLLDLVRARLRHGPLQIKAHRGTLQRALQVLTGELDAPLLASRRLMGEVAVYRTYGYAIDDVVAVDSPDGRDALRNGAYIRFYGKGDRMPVDPPPGTTVVLSAFMARPDHPLLEYTERSYRVAMSNHADFLGTVEYVRATGARYVITDNTRGGHAIELARELEARLGVTCRASKLTGTARWGV